MGNKPRDWFDHSEYRSHNLSCLMVCCIVLCCVVLPCLVLSCLVLSCLVLPYVVTCCLVLCYGVLSCLALSCLVLSYIMVWYGVMRCGVLSCIVLSCLACLGLGLGLRWGCLFLVKWVQTKWASMENITTEPNLYRWHQAVTYARPLDRKTRQDKAPPR